MARQVSFILLRKSGLNWARRSSHRNKWAGLPPSYIFQFTLARLKYACHESLGGDARQRVLSGVADLPYYSFGKVTILVFPSKIIEKYCKYVHFRQKLLPKRPEEGTCGLQFEGTFPQ